jgi:hypothetical protein
MSHVIVPILHVNHMWSTCVFHTFLKAVCSCFNNNSLSSAIFLISKHSLFALSASSLRLDTWRQNNDVKIWLELPLTNLIGQPGGANASDWIIRRTKGVWLVSYLWLLAKPRKSVQELLTIGHWLTVSKWLEPSRELFQKFKVFTL